MKAEKFIQDYTRNCSNAIYDPYDTDDAITIYAPWLTPDQAREAVEIAREEIYEWLEENAAKSLIHYLRQAIEDE